MKNQTASFHTFEAHLRIKPSEYRKYKDILFNYCSKNHKKIYELNDIENFDSLLLNNLDPFELEKYPDISVMDRKVIICEALKENGVIVQLIECVKSTPFDSIPLYSGLWLKINPRRVTNDNDYVGIFDINDIHKMFEAVDKLLKNLHWSFPTLEEFMLARLDFCKNVYLGSQYIVEKYISLSKRCIIPSGYNMELFYDKKNRKYRLSKDGIIISNKSSSFVIYNKKAQMNNQDYNFPDEESAEGILRFEFQALRNKLYYMGKKNDVSTIKNFLQKGDQYAIALFNNYMPQFFCLGDYLTYKKAQDKIIGMNYKKRTEKNMLEFLENASIHKSLDKVINEMKQSSYSKTQILYLLNRFNEINVNPITIPREWNVEILPNPIKLINANHVIII